MTVGRAGGATSPRDLGRFGKYSLVARLATGGMAEVLLARYTGLAGFERQVVIKRILPHHAREERYVTMFLAEARISARLAHPNIAHVYELGEVDGHYYMAMEYLEGVTLDTLIRRMKLAQKPSDLRLVAGLIVQACEGLQHAHELTDPEGQASEVVHRDVSPHNLFVTTAGVLKVLDFGVAKAQWATPKTADGVVKGTYSYMSPEQLRGERVDCRSDVFGLGIVLFELVTLKRLFHRETDYLVFNAITTEDAPRVSSLRADLPSDLVSVIAKALARNRDERLASARELGLQVTRAIEPLGGPHLPGVLAVDVRRLCADDLDELRSVIASGGRPIEPSGVNPMPEDADEPAEDRDPTQDSMASTVRPGDDGEHPPITAADERPTTPAGPSRIAGLALARTESPDDSDDPLNAPTARSDQPARVELTKPLPSAFTAVGPPPMPRRPSFLDAATVEQDEDRDDEPTTASPLEEPPHPFGVPVEDPFEVGPTSLSDRAPVHEPSELESGETLPGARYGLPQQEQTVPSVSPVRATPPPGAIPRVPTARIPMHGKLPAIAPRLKAVRIPDLGPNGVRIAKLAFAFFLSAGVGIVVLLTVRWMIQEDRAPEPPAPPERSPASVERLPAPSVKPPPPAPAPAPTPTPAPTPAAPDPAPLAPAATPPSTAEEPQADPRFPKPTRRSGFVTVEGKPSHIAFIDGKRIGALPVRRYPIGPGRHDIVIQVPRGKPKHFPVWVRTGKEVPVRVE